MNERACASGCVGVIIGSEDRFCYKCGGELIARPKCGDCARPFLVGVERFCPKCGKRLPFMAGQRSTASLLTDAERAEDAEQAQKKVEGAAS